MIFSMNFSHAEVLRILDLVHNIVVHNVSVGVLLDLLQKMLLEHMLLDNSLQHHGNKMLESSFSKRDVI